MWIKKTRRQEEEKKKHLVLGDKREKKFQNARQ
jgi:hypothetical protein